MSVNLLAINVGNTRTQLGAFDAGALGAIEYVDNGGLDAAAEAMGRLYGPLRDAGDAAVYLVSVNDDASDRVEQAVRQALGVKAQRLERDVAVPIGRQLDPESIIGADRLLNGAAAFDRLGQACIVVDAGTAVTVDFVDGAGTFHGGAIMPGARMMLTAMHNQATLLPEVDFASPDEPIGHNTVQAMLSGVFYGIRGAVRELVEKFAESYGAYPKIIATGGDAQKLFDHYELIEAVVPELTLQGMAVTRRFALDQSQGAL